MVESYAREDRWMVIWVLWILSVLAGEIVSPWFWLGSLVWFGVFEGWAVKRAKLGDTLSEQFWRLLFERTGRVRPDGRPVRRLLPARVPLVLGVGGYICLVALSALTGRIDELMWWRVGTLTGGLFIWLVPLHFLGGGRWG